MIPDVAHQGPGRPVAFVAFISAALAVALAVPAAVSVPWGSRSG